MKPVTRWIFITLFLYPKIISDYQGINNFLSELLAQIYTFMRESAIVCYTFMRELLGGCYTFMRELER